MQTKLFNYFCKISLCLCCCTNSMETKNTKSSNVEAKSEKTKERSNNVIRLTFVIVLWDSLLYIYIFSKESGFVVISFVYVPVFSGALSIPVRLLNFLQFWFYFIHIYMLSKLFIRTLICSFCSKPELKQPTWKTSTNNNNSKFK